MNCTGQGWEPIRRDDAWGQIVFDISAVRTRIAKVKNPGSFFLTFEYYSCSANGLNWYGGRIPNESEEFKSAKDAIQAIGKIVRKKDSLIQTSLALVAWGDARKPVSSYRPDDTTSVAELLERAQEYGCGDGISRRLKEFTDEVIVSLPEQDLDLAVLVVVKHPCPLIGDSSDLEVIPYRVAFTADRNRQINLSRAAVFPLRHIHKLNPDLLARVSGRNPTQAGRSRKVVLLGCGSLGSKIVSHLARAGYGPFSLFDHDFFSPHNNARHAVANRIGAEFGLRKTSVVKEFLQELGAEVREYTVDVVKHLQDNEKPLGRTAALVIDATAASNVLEALCAAPPRHLGAPLLRTALYGQGHLGLFALEGKDRNPRIDDLTIQLYQLGLDDPTLGRQLYGDTGKFSRLNIGQGFSSYTMPMSDGRISLFAAGMAERISCHLNQGLLDTGELLIGILDSEGMGITWKRYPAPRIRVISLNQDAWSWEIRIPSHLEKMMSMQSAQARPSETGGGLIGHINWGRRVIYVSGLIPPPDDSVSNQDRFILGTRGLGRTIARIEKTTGSVLTYLGTWHSHPEGGPESFTDQATLKQLALERGRVPSLCLIYGPGGLFAVNGAPTTLGV